MLRWACDAEVRRSLIRAIFEALVDAFEGVLARGTHVRELLPADADALDDGLALLEDFFVARHPHSGEVQGISPDEVHAATAPLRRMLEALGCEAAPPVGLAGAGALAHADVTSQYI